MKTIVITGVSSGLGQAIAEAALQHGHRVVGTLRREDQRAAFEAKVPGRSFGRILDVTDTAAIAPFVNAVESEIGPIDVLINNAGYGLKGVLEELGLDDVRKQVEVNVVGPLALAQAVLPGMRARRAGHILNMASMGSFIAYPGLGAYHISKFAILGMTDALAKEVESLGISVTAIMPGLFKTDWSGRSLEEATHRISDYDRALSGPSIEMKGEPAALADVVLKAIEMERPPAHLLVGPSAVTNVRERIAQWSQEIDRWADLSDSTGEG